MSTLVQWFLSAFVLAPLLILAAVFVAIRAWGPAAVVGLAAVAVYFAPEIGRAVRR
ncbi:MAG: hypothetical protein AABY01_04100 [Nanoarchaeota archaeon]